MKISTKGRYALRFMLDLAANGEGRYVPLKEISARQGISLKYLEQIVSQFGKLGLLESVRGPQGGYRLAKLPKDYTVGEILRYAEGELAPVACLEGEKNLCNRAATCKTLPMWTKLDMLVNDFFEDITLADLLQETADGNHYVI